MRAPTEAALLAEQPVLSRSTDTAPSGADDNAAAAVTPRPPDRTAGEPLVVARQVESPANSASVPSSASSSGASTMSSAVTVQCLADDHTGHDHQSTDQPAADRQAVDRLAGDHPPDGPAVVGESAADRPVASMPSVVQRSASADLRPSVAMSGAEQPAAARPEVATPTLGSRPEAVAAVRSSVASEASPATRTTASMPALVVPIQRTASTTPGRPQPRTEAEPARIAVAEDGVSAGGGDAAPPVQRLATEPATPQHAATESDSARYVPAEPDPPAGDETARASDASSVSSRVESAAESATEQTSALLADRAPLMAANSPTAPGEEPGGTVSAEPLIVVGHRDPGAADPVQRLATTATPTLSPALLGAQLHATDPSPVEPTAHAWSGPSLPGPTVGEAGELSGSAGDFTDYPPLVARSVQRRVADVESGEATDEQAPLSGFAAAISALTGEAPVQSSTAADGSAVESGTAAGPSELVVARQVATTPRAAAGAGASGRPPGVALSSASSFAAPPTRVVPELVVARRMAPDGGGNLPAADVRLTGPAPLPGLGRIRAPASRPRSCSAA